MAIPFHDQVFFSELSIEHSEQSCYYKCKENNRPQGVDLLNSEHRKCHPLPVKVWGWFFYALKHYLINVKTNVSNAKMNIPKAIRSLKSKEFLSISTTPILCKNRGPPPCNTVVSYDIILPFYFTSDNSYNCHIQEKKAPMIKISSRL